MNFVLVGLGYWGPNLLRVFNNLDSIYAVVDKDLNKVDKFSNQPQYKNIKFDTDWKKFLADDNVNGFIVATPPNTHYDIAREALICHKHVFVEKPMTLDAGEAADLANLAKANNLILLVGHVFLYSPEISKLKEIVNSSEFGSIYYAYVQRLNLGQIQAPANVIEDLAPHDISVLNFIFNDKCNEVLAVGKGHIIKDIEDVAFITMKFSRGAIAHLHLSWLDPLKVRNTVIVGTKQMVVCDSGLKKIEVYNKSVNINERKNLTNTSYARHLLSYTYGDVVLPYIDSIEPLMAEAEDFISCIKNNQTPVANGDMGVNVVSVLEAMQKSLKGGQTWQKV